MPNRKALNVLIAEDDDGHAFLIEEGLRRAGVEVPILRFSDGAEILDFLHGRTEEPSFAASHPYLLLLDIRMPKVGGLEVLRQIKSDPQLHNLPVTILTTTEDPREVERCHHLQCNNYIQKPTSWEEFSGVMEKLGHFVSLLQVPNPRPTPTAVAA
jgi:CheY-like chemotaxis protein